MIQAKVVHFIGIGGIGVSASAKWWLAQGAKVSGSDLAMSPILEELDRLGVEVKIGHFADNIPRSADLIIYSSAVPATNPEREYATEHGIRTLSYFEFLGELSREKKTIAVSGTNGKSTTTAMIGKILVDAGYDPTIILGTKSPDFPEGNLRIGNGEWFVVEACEHMAHMLLIKPRIAVITNIEEDHLDYYRDLDHIRETFQEWINADGCKVVVVNAEDPESQKLKVQGPAYFKAVDRRVENGRQYFDVSGVEVALRLPGAFNAMNAAAAFTASHVVGVPDEVALASLAEFKGTWRRFEHVGMYKEADVYSDYGHHPTAIKGTISAFKEFFPERRLILAFEPHQHSRTHELFAEFATAFDGLNEKDQLIISEIYEVAGRTEAHYESGEDLAEAIRKSAKGAVSYAKDHASVTEQISALVNPGDIIVIMGAGPIDNVARKLVI